MKHFVCLILAAFVSIASAQEDATKKQLDKFTSEFAAAWEKNDYAKLTETFAEGGDLIDPFGNHVKGRETLKEYIKQLHEGPMKGTKYDIQKSESRMVTPDVAVLDWDVVITGMKTSSGNGELKHHVTSVLVKRDGKWEVVASRPAVAAPPLSVKNSKTD